MILAYAYKIELNSIGDAFALHVRAVDFHCWVREPNESCIYGRRKCKRMRGCDKACLDVEADAQVAEHITLGFEGSMQDLAHIAIALMETLVVFAIVWI